MSVRGSFMPGFSWLRLGPTETFAVEVPGRKGTPAGPCWTTPDLEGGTIVRAAVAAEAARNRSGRGRWTQFVVLGRDHLPAPAAVFVSRSTRLAVAGRRNVGRSKQSSAVALSGWPAERPPTAKAVATVGSGSAVTGRSSASLLTLALDGREVRRDSVCRLGPADDVVAPLADAGENHACETHDGAGAFTRNRCGGLDW
jgi:hypothetical protein